MTSVAEPVTPLASLRLPRGKAVAATIAAVALAVVAIATTPVEQWFAGTLLAFALAWASVVDIDRFILPDVITLGLVIAGLALHAVAGDPHLMLGSAAGALLGYGVLALAAALFRRIRGRDGLGLGDAKLLAAAGAWLGWSSLPGVLLAASAAGLAWALLGILRHGANAATQPLPFGPFISAAFFAAWLIRT